MRLRSLVDAIPPPRYRPAKGNDDMALDDRDYMRDRARRGRSSVNRDSWMGIRPSARRPTRSPSDPKTIMWFALFSAVFGLVVTYSIENDRGTRRTASPGRSRPTTLIEPGTGPNGRSEPAYVPPPVAPEVPFPQSGSLGWWSGVAPGLPMAEVTIRDVSGDPRYKVYRLRQASTGARLVDVYLAPGGSAVLSLPLDTYAVSLAVGRRWEGQERQFGPFGLYWDMNPVRYSTPSGPGGATYERTILPFRVVAHSTNTSWRDF